MTESGRRRMKDKSKHVGAVDHDKAMQEITLWSNVK